MSFPPPYTCTFSYLATNAPYLRKLNHHPNKHDNTHSPIFPFLPYTFSSHIIYTLIFLQFIPYSHHSLPITSLLLHYLKKTCLSICLSLRNLTFCVKTAEPNKPQFVVIFLSQTAETNKPQFFLVTKKEYTKFYFLFFIVPF